jgi:hypothetical protein
VLWGLAMTTTRTKGRAHSRPAVAAGRDVVLHGRHRSTQWPPERAQPSGGVSGTTSGIGTQPQPPTTLGGAQAAEGGSDAGD